MSKTPEWVINYRKIKSMNDQELINFVNGFPRIVNNLPVGWEENPHRYHVNILAVLNFIHLTDEEWNERQKTLNDTLR
jgi:hypothetical protein